MKRVLFLVVLLISTNVFAQWQHLPGPYGALATNFAGLSSDTNFILVGTNYGAYRTTDGGQSWLLSGFADSNVSQILCIPFNGQDVFLALVNPAFSPGGGMFRSFDSGQSWELLPNGHNTLCALGDTLFGNGGIEIDWSFDAGSTWHVFSMLPSNIGLVQLFTSGDYLLAYIKDTTFLRWNSAVGWDTSLFIDIMEPQAFAASGNNVIAGTYGGVSISSDNGLDWIRPNNVGINSFVPVQNLTANDSIILFSLDDEIFRSSNQGNSWQIVSLNHGLTQVAYLGTVNGVFFASDGMGFYKSNDGLNWSFITTNGIPEATIWSLVAVNDTLYAALSEGIIYSTDHGMTWPSSNIILQDSGVRYLTEQNNELVPYGNGFWKKSSNGTWYNPSGIEIEQLTYESGIWYGIIEGDQVGKSTDSGYSWENISGGLPTDSGVTLICPAYGRLFAIEGDGAIYVSYDSGSIWTFLSSYPNSIYAENYAVNSFGFFVGTDEGLIWSSDSCVTWSIDSALWNIDIEVLQNFNGGILAGVYGDNDSGVNFDLLFTSNGKKWTSISPKFFNIFSIAADDQYAYIGLWDDGIWRTPLSDLPTSSVSVQQPSSISLSIFPNPSSSSSTISFYLPVHSYISLNLYDELGILRSSIFEGEMDAGQHNIPFADPSLSNGIYEVVLSTAINRSVARLVLER